MSADLIAEVLAQHRTQVIPSRRLGENHVPNGRPRLTRPNGTDPAGFAARVATAYNAVAAATHRPAAVLAEEAGVPVTTVHRWIREARQRGFLPSAQRGSVGSPSVWRCSCGAGPAERHADREAAVVGAEQHQAQRVAEAIQLGAPDVTGSDPTHLGEAPQTPVPAAEEVA